MYVALFILGKATTGTTGTAAVTASSGKDIHSQ